MICNPCCQNRRCPYFGKPAERTPIPDALIQARKTLMPGPFGDKEGAELTLTKLWQAGLCLHPDERDFRTFVYSGTDEKAFPWRRALDLNETVDKAFKLDVDNFLYRKLLFAWRRRVDGEEGFQLNP